MVRGVSMREINQKGLDLLKQLEGCKLTSYQDQGGLWTIGYGSTPLNHPEIVKGLTINLEQAEMYLKKDLEKFYQLDHYLSEQVNENQYSALICLTYNVGLAAVKLSQTLKLINEGLPPDKEWMGFNKVNGVTNNGLINRRGAELCLYHELS
jgi:lysozyme